MFPYLCACEYRYPRRAKEDVGCPEVGVTGIVSSLILVLRTELRSSIRTVCGLDSWAISSALPNDVWRSFQLITLLWGICIFHYEEILLCTIKVTKQIKIEHMFKLVVYVNISMLWEQCTFKENSKFLVSISNSFKIWMLFDPVSRMHEIKFENLISERCQFSLLGKNLN